MDREPDIECRYGFHKNIVAPSCRRRGLRCTSRDPPVGRGRVMRHGSPPEPRLPPPAAPRPLGVLDRRPRWHSPARGKTALCLPAGPHRPLLERGPSASRTVAPRRPAR
jgi:hypothetical protein